VVAEHFTQGLVHQVSGGVVAHGAFARHQVDLAEFPHVQRWYRAMQARPGVARGFAVPLRHGT